MDGSVYDADNGFTISGASVKMLETGFHTTTDNFGAFQFENIPVGLYRLEIGADGYKSQKIETVEISEDITTHLSIKLTPIIYELDKIVVETEKHPVSSKPVEIISKQEIRNSGATDISQLLESVPGVSIKQTGSSGQSQVSIRGSKPEHVLVLVDGIKLNPSGTGVADLSGIPIESIEKIEIHKGGVSTEFGSDALAGAINIITRPVSLFSDISVGVKEGHGSWKATSSEINITNPLHLKNYSSRWFYKNQKAKNNFDFAYSVEGTGADSVHTGTRINSAYNSENFFASGIYKFNGKLSLNYSGQSYSNSHGLPDRATRQNEFASADDKRRLFSTGLLYDISRSSGFNIVTGYARYQQHFVDDNQSSVFKFNSEFVNEIYSVESNYRYSPWLGAKTRLSTKFQHEYLNHTDNQRPDMSMGHSERDNFSTMLSIEQQIDISPLKIFNLMVLDASTRYNYAKTFKDSTSYRDTVRTNSAAIWTPKVGLALSGGTEISYLFRTSYGKSFRLPGINSLFWKGDIQSSGNPGLKPEKSEHSEAGVEVQWDKGIFDLSAGLTYYHSSITDLVVWAPNSQGIWVPSNLARAQITGHEDFVRVGLFDKNLIFEYQNCITTALNKTAGQNSYNKSLTFSPGYTTSFSLKLNLAPLYGTYQTRLVDKAFTNEANTRYYDAYRVDNASLGLKLNIAKNWQFTTEARVDNINDNNYVLITHYPMPGREWNFHIGLSYGTAGGD